MREVIESAGVIVVEMGQNDCLDVLCGIDVRRLEARANPFQWSHFDNDHLHKEGIPSR